MSPEDTESTPLLYASNANAASSQEGDQVTIASADPHEQRSHTRLASSYRRPSFVAGGGRGLIFASSPIPESALRDDEAFDCVMEERGLLKRNSIIGVPPSSGGRRGSMTANAVADVEETWEEAVEAGRIKTSWRYELGVMTRYSVFTPTSIELTN